MPTCIALYHATYLMIWLMCNKVFTQFCLLPTHEPYLPLLPSHKASPPFGWYSLRLPTKGWPGWVDLGGRLHTRVNVRHLDLNPDTVTNPSTNRASHRLTSLVESSVLPLHQTTIVRVRRSYLTLSALFCSHCPFLDCFICVYGLTAARMGSLPTLVYGLWLAVFLFQCHCAGYRWKPAAARDSRAVERYERRCGVCRRHDRSSTLWLCRVPSLAARASFLWPRVSLW